MPEPIVFIGGAPRSGTTLLRNQLNRHPLLAIPNESYFIRETLLSLNAMGRPADPSLAWRLIRASPSFAAWGLDEMVAESWLRERDPATFPDLVSCLFEAVAHDRDRAHTGDKTTTNALMFDVLGECFPASRFIHVLRDPREVCMSAVLQHWSRGGLAAAAESWRLHVVRARRAAATLGSRLLEVRYEDLVADPEKALTTVCQFLGLPFDPVVLRSEAGASPLLEIHHRRARQPVEANPRRWRAAMSASDIALVEHVAGPALVKAGYEASRARMTLSAWRELAAEEFQQRLRWCISRHQPDGFHETLRLDGARTKPWSLVTGTDPPGPASHAVSLQPPSIGVVIAARDAEAHLGACVSSLLTQDPAPHQVVVVDDGSSDRTVQTAAMAGATVVRLGGWAGPSAARNAGARVCTGDVVAFVDSDAVAAPGWLASLVAAASHGARLMAGGFVLDGPETLVEAYSHRQGYGHSLSAQNGFLPSASTANLAIERQLFERLGGFDTRLRAGEDTDLTFRAQLDGAPLVLVEGAMVRHRHRHTPKSYLIQTARNARDLPLMSWKYQRYPFFDARRRSRTGRPVVEFARGAGWSLTLGRQDDGTTRITPWMLGAARLTTRLSIALGWLDLARHRRQPPLIRVPATVDEAKTARPLPSTPSLVLAGTDRVLLRVLAKALDAHPQLASPAPLEPSVRGGWHEAAPWSLGLVDDARSAGWRMERYLAARRLEDNGPLTRGDAWLALCGVVSWLRGKERCALSMVASPLELESFGLPRPLVVVGDDRSDTARCLTVTHTDLWERPDVVVPHILALAGLDDDPAVVRMLDALRRTGRWSIRSERRSWPRRGRVSRRAGHGSDRPTQEA